MSRDKLLKPDKCFLHLIDLQESLMKQIHNSEKVAATALLMLKCARILGVTVTGNTQYRRGLGPYVPELESQVTDVARPDKVEFNCFANSETAALCNTLPSAVSSVLLVGVETHICVYQTAMGAIEKGLTPYIIADGVSSRHPEHHAAGLDRITAIGGVVMPAEMVIYELLGKAATPEFKQVLPLIIERG